MSRRDMPPEAPAALQTAEQLAFAQGKRAREAGRASSSNPYRKALLAEAWHRGYRYAASLRMGLVPLDTARRLP